MGPGSYEWTTRVEARFWDLGDDLLIPLAWVERARDMQRITSGERAIGVDLAPYGSSESVIAVRQEDTLIDLRAHPAGRTDHFIYGESDNELGPVRRAVVEHCPWYVIYDADGVGAGAVGDFDRLHRWAIRERYMRPDSAVIGFRGGKGSIPAYFNNRSAWWWALRKRFERGAIGVRVQDPKLDAQLSQMTYKITPSGAIRVETKDEMRRRGLVSPDRADGVMYAFAYSEALPDPQAPGPASVVLDGYVSDRSEDAMWRKDLDAMKNTKTEVNAVFGLPDEL
jgi:hypothetical protein